MWEGKPAGNGKNEGCLSRLYSTWFVLIWYSHHIIPWGLGALRTLDLFVFSALSRLDNGEFTWCSAPCLVFVLASSHPLDRLNIGSLLIFFLELINFLFPSYTSILFDLQAAFTSARHGHLQSPHLKVLLYSLGTGFTSIASLIAGHCRIWGPTTMPHIWV